MNKILITLPFLFLFLPMYSQLSGIYTIGKSPSNNYDFNSISDAADSIHMVGVSGPVIFKIDSGLYTEVIHIQSINNASPTNTITFESLSGDSNDVIIKFDFQNNSGIIFYIDSVRNVIIKNLTIKLEGIGDSTAECHNIYISHNSESIKIQNNLIIGNKNGLGIFHTIYNSGKNTKIINNLINYGDAGIINFQNSFLEKGINQIIQNQIIDFKTVGISCSTDSTIISDNQIATSIDSLFNVGIDISHGVQYIFNNKIINPNIAISAVDNRNAYIFNNIISIDRPNYDNFGFKDGFYNSSFNLYFNTINIISGTAQSNCINKHYGVGGIFNNILVNSIGPVLNMDTSNSGLFFNNIIHTEYTKIAKIGNPPKNYITINDLQQNNLCSNSIDTLPYFNSINDLHLSFNQFTGIGTANYPFIAYPSNIIGESFDIDHEPRNMTFVKPGADEYFQDSIDILPLIIISPNSEFSFPKSDTIEVIIMNAGLLAVSSYIINIYISGTLLSSDTIYKSIQPNQTDTIKLGNLIYPSQDFYISAITKLSSDQNPYNDSIYKKIINKIIDVGVYEILSPKTFAYAKTKPKIIIKNYGNTTIQNIPLFYSSWLMQINDTFNNSIFPGDTSVFQFSFPSPDFWDDTILCIATNYYNDSNPANDSICELCNFLPTQIKTSDNLIYKYRIFPNPCNNYINFEISSNDISNLKIEIYTIMGQRIISKEINLSPVTKTIQIDIHNQPSGILFYNILNKKQRVISGKIIKF